MKPRVGILDKIDTVLDEFPWTDAADSTAHDLDDQAEEDPFSPFALVDNGWLSRQEAR